MKIVFATDQYWPSISGVSVSVDAFRDELVRMGHEVHLFVPDYPEAAIHDSKTMTSNIHRFKSRTIFYNEENRFVKRNEREHIYDQLDAIKPDIIHTHTEFSMGKMLSSYARNKNISLVRTAHTNWEELITHYVRHIPKHLVRYYCRWFIRTTYNKSDLVIVPTSIMELLLNLYFVNKPIRVIPTGIEDFIFSKSPAIDLREKYPILKGKKILLFAGRIGKEKNILFLVDVLTKLRESNPDLMLVLCGDGPAMADVKLYAQMKGVFDAILFVGFVLRSELSAYYRLADVFVFASKVESQGMVILESMACGTPVVAIGKMGTREVMGGDYGGFMVDDDFEDFCNKVQLLLTDELIHNEKSKEGMLHVQKWTLKVQADKLETLYNKLLDMKMTQKCTCF